MARIGDALTFPRENNAENHNVNKNYLD